MLRHLARGYVLDRMMRGGRRRHHHRRRRHGGGLFPLPHYTRRTRRGSRVSVGGCCLPIPLGVLAISGVAARMLLRR